ncbi:undecaprenyl/decaprenyl-phosphate alpha-N-acetylglucosaminyl 1-phosphate transferase [Patescibacteria group bacterium]|nr:undecaprenyl/decaprenyl-phosphate alpha-N-acetylglucosaminyl 1-phosphate transferase [Patescibacteria group bacterium]
MKIIFFIISFIVAYSLTFLVKKVAWHFKIVDNPDNLRKIHSQPVALLGGTAIWLTVLLLVGYLAFFTDLIIGRDITARQIISLMIGSGLLMVGGYLDDCYKLKPWQQILWPLLAVATVMVGGVTVSAVTNPLGGVIKLNDFWPYLGLFLTFFWLLGTMYTTKLLDGLDGLATGIGLIGSLIIFGLTQVTAFYQPSVGYLALVMAGACLGFLWWNWQPAKIFLGEGGSLYIGFMLGVLAIISGSKIATALLVMGVPILDVVWVIIRRLFLEKKSLAASDRRHLHHRLLDVGLSHRQAVVFLYVLTALFGLTALFLSSLGKIWALLVLVLVMIMLGIVLVWAYKKKQGQLI